MYSREAIINDILGIDYDKGGLPVNAFEEDPPPFVMPMHEEDEYGSEGEVYTIENGKFGKVKVKDLRKKKCEWTMGGQLLQLIQARSVYRDFEDENGDEYTEIFIICYDPKEKKYRRFNDDFEDEVKELYGIDQESAEKMVETLLRKNDGNWIGIFLVR